MNTLLLVIFVVLFLGGCQLSQPRSARGARKPERLGPV